MKINVVKIIDSAKPQGGSWSREQVAKDWELATLYQIEKRDILEIVRGGKHVRYLMRRAVR